MDEVEKTQDKAKDESSEASSGEKKQSSQPKLSAEAEVEIQKRVSDKLAKKGDEAKVLREQLDVLLAKDKVRESERLEEVAKRHGYTVEQLTKAGYDTADEVEAAVTFFKKDTETTKEPAPIPDSGKIMGGSVSDAQFIADYSDGKNNDHKRAKEILKQLKGG